MADFRQLALEFVLADEQPKLRSLVQQAASEIQTAPPNTNPVARWVESVQPWMPGSNGEDLAEDGEENTNWTARAKALEFLSQTLECLSNDILKPSQVKLLIAFFGAMFEIDHKAGILASATALSKIVSMKAFQPQFGNEIIQKVCSLKEDFPRQISKTRVAIYTLIRSLVTDPAVASDLKYRHGAPSGFMNDLLQLCRNERDPDCLMVWFDTLRYFLAEYECSQEMSDEVYETFKAYFPITLPRTSPSGITPEDLKLRLRKCFSSNYRLAQSAYPFLIARLDQGDGVTVNVKVDVLKTIKACLEEYQHPEQSVIPFINQIWGSLKYEVRNGEIEDTIWATLEVLKTLATRLKGDDLRDYTLTVTRDCVNDLSNTTYTAASGRLLISVLSANPSAFVLMVAPAVTHIKENLRHPKSPLHTQDLLKLLHVILETRILLVDSEMTAQERSDFGAIDTIFKTLYEDVYRSPVGLGSKPDASYDEIKISTQAVQGAGALVCQRSVKAADLPTSMGAQSGRLIPEETCSHVVEALFAIITQSISDDSRKNGSDELINETTKALQRSIRGFSSGFKPLVNQGMDIIHSSWSSPQTIQTMGSLLAFVGCSELPSPPAEGLSHFIYYILTLTRELFASMDAKADPSTWCSLAAAIQSTARYFNDSCLAHNPEKDRPLEGDSWLNRIQEKYPELGTITGDAATVDPPATLSAVPATASATEIRNDFLLVSVFIARQLYRAVSKSSGNESLELSDNFTASGNAAEYQFLHLISGFAGFTVHEMSESQQLSLHVEEFSLNLFREDSIKTPAALTEEQKASGLEHAIREHGSNWSWLALGRLNVLSFGILEALRPSGVARLFDCGVAQEVIISGVFYVSGKESKSRAVTRSILTVLANKYKIETLENLMATFVQGPKQPEGALNVLDVENSLEQATSIFAVAAGMLRRYSGKLAQPLLQILREAPMYPAIGHRLARRLEMVIAPQGFLTKYNFAVVKPLWMQKVYFELAKPLLQTALDTQSEAQDPLIKANLSVGVLLLIKHMNYAIYEEDAEKILRVAISIAQTLGTGPETRAALDVLRNILVEAPEKAQDHVRSLINICIASFSSRSAPVAKPAWLPLDYSSAAADAEAQAAGGKLALEIVGGLPKILEAPLLVPYARQMERELTLACGHGVRDLRRSARSARAAWAELK